MAIHYIIDKKEEPKLFRSVKRISKYIMNNAWRSMKDWDELHTYGKTVQKLPLTYCLYKNTRVFSIAPYNLQNKKWDERKIGGLNFREGANLQVHTNDNGDIVAIYYPI